MRTRNLLAAVAVALTTLAATPPASAHQPYGGCDEAWQAPRSGGATHCRQHRWIVRPRVVIGPHGYVRANLLPPCASDDIDGHACYWNAAKRGNHQGDSFVVVGTYDHHRVIYVEGFSS